MTRKSVTDEQVGQLHRRTAEVIRRVSEGTLAFEATMLALQEVIEGAYEVAIGEKYTIVVDYNQSLRQMVEAGKYDIVDPEIEEAIKEISSREGRGKKTVEVVLFHSGGDISCSEIVKEMDKRGYRPAELEELLVLGSAYPTLQVMWHLTIMAPGSVLRSKWAPPPSGREIVPELSWCNVTKHTALITGDFWFRYDKKHNIHFAAVRK